MSQDKLILGLDVPTVEKAREVIATLGDEVNFYKIGYQLVFAGGLDLAKELVSDGKKVFLDMKLLDIGNTVAHGVENIVKMGVDILTIHAYPDAMKAAVSAAKGSQLKLLGVTVMTSMDDRDLAEAGYAQGVTSLVLRRALQARDAGMSGVVASSLEAEKIRKIVGEDMLIVTPGVRLDGDQLNDQKRVMSPKDALEAGANYLVMSRPILNAPNMVDMVKKIKANMNLAVSGD